MTIEYGLGGPKIFRDVDDGVGGGISLDMSGSDPKKKRITTTVVTTIHNKTTGKYAGQKKLTYESDHNASMDEIPPIDPDTGKPLEGFQEPLNGVLGEGDGI